MSLNERIPGWVVFNKFASSGVNITIAVIISIIVAIVIYEQLKSS